MTQIQHPFGHIVTTPPPGESQAEGEITFPKSTPQEINREAEESLDAVVNRRLPEVAVTFAVPRREEPAYFTEPGNEAARITYTTQRKTYEGMIAVTRVRLWRVNHRREGESSSDAEIDRTLLCYVQQADGTVEEHVIVQSHEKGNITRRDGCPVFVDHNPTPFEIIDRHLDREGGVWLTYKAGEQFFDYNSTAQRNIPLNESHS